jgi:hypothetical protein
MKTCDGLDLLKQEKERRVEELFLLPIRITYRFDMPLSGIRQAIRLVSELNNYETKFCFENIVPIVFENETIALCFDVPYNVARQDVLEALQNIVLKIENEEEKSYGA